MAEPLATFAYGMLRDGPAAEDMVQQAFLELTEAAPDFRGDGRSLRAWMYRCVRFRCLDEIRRRKNRPESPLDESPDVEPAESRDPVDEMIDPELETALESLTEAQRTVLILRHVVGLSGAETAKVTATNRVAVYAMASRAEASLRKALEAVESSLPATSETVKGGQQRVDTSTVKRKPTS